MRAAAAPLYVAVWTAIYTACLLIAAMTGAVVLGKLAYAPGERVDALYGRVQQDVRQLEAVAWPPHAPQRAVALARTLHAWIFEKSGLAQRVASVRTAEAGSLDQRLTAAAGTLAADGGESWQLAMLGTYFFGVRLICLATLLPLLAAAYALGFIDGLVERSIRRAGAGRESASLYHRAKWGLAVLAIGVPTLYLAVPLDVRIGEAAPFAALGVLLLARIQWKYYKKYL